MFYTYIWRDGAGVPFYVGKGVKRRARALSKRSAEFMAIHTARAYDAAALAAWGVGNCYLNFPVAA